MIARKYRVVVTGGRSYTGRREVYEVLDNLKREHQEGLCIIQGGQSGADALARRWAQEHGVKGLTVDALWTYYGRFHAGPIRNRWMAEEDPDVVIAFPGGKGTADMCRAAKAAGIPILRVDDHGVVTK